MLHTWAGNALLQHLRTASFYLNACASRALSASGTVIGRALPPPPIARPHPPTNCVLRHHPTDVTPQPPLALVSPPHNVNVLRLQLRHHMAASLTDKQRDLRSSLATYIQTCEHVNPPPIAHCRWPCTVYSCIYTRHMRYMGIIERKSQI